MKSFRLLLANKHDISENDLNHHYGKYGRSFKASDKNTEHENTISEAREKAIKHKNALKKQGVNSYITRLIDYKEKDVLCMNGVGTHINGAIPLCKGYLVTVLK